MSPHSWDILAGDTWDTVYLVLDLCNKWGAEAEVRYGGVGEGGRGKLMVQAGDSCRVPVRVPRCARDLVSV